MFKKLQAKGNSGKEEIFQRVVFGRAISHEIEECLWTDDERNDLSYIEGSLYPITKISLIKEIMVVEAMQEISLLKGMDQAFKIGCRFLNLKGQFLNVVRLWQISTVAPQVCHLRELVVSVKAILINVRVLLCLPQNWDQTRKHLRKKLTVVMSAT